MISNRLVTLHPLVPIKAFAGVAALRGCRSWHWCISASTAASVGRRPVGGRVAASAAVIGGGRLLGGQLVSLALGLHGGVYLVNSLLQGVHRIPVGFRRIRFYLANLINNLLQAVTHGRIGHLPVGVTKQL